MAAQKDEPASGHNRPDSKKIAVMARQFLSILPHCKLLGIQLKEVSGNGLTLELPWSEQIIGDIDSGTIHSGVVTTLMDTACGISTVCVLPEPEACPTLDLRIDHMARPDPHRPLYATAESYRVTRNIIFARGTAWQDSPEQPLVHAVGTFMRLGKSLVSQGLGAQQSREAQL